MHSIPISLFEILDHGVGEKPSAPSGISACDLLRQISRLLKSTRRDRAKGGAIRNREISR
jgi:hypothetical protein